jgi:cytosine/adenosine deaminase-related metal-dependent hydrolase
LVWEEARRLQRKRPNTPTCRTAFSPHAPYSVNIGLIRNIAWNGHMLAIHLAETREELELLAKQTGPFRDFLIELGVWEPGGLAGSIDEILRRCRPAQQALFIHGNYLAADTPLPDNATVVYCPRTHAAFGHEPHPFRDFLQRCVRVALGTDSLASNPDLDMLAEMRFVHQKHPDFPGNALLRMGTLSGAEALGWADETGSLAAGKSADLVTVPLPNEEAEPFHLLFNSSHKVDRTMFCGQWVAG